MRKLGKLAPAIGNGIWNALASLSLAVVGMVGSVLIVQSLGQTNYGTLAYYTWLGNILVTLVTLAFPNALTKLASELHGRKESEEAHALSRAVISGLLGLGFLVTLGIVVWALLTEPPQRTYLFLVALFPVPGILMALLASHLWSQQRYRLTSITTIIGAAVQLALIVLAYVRDWGVPGYLFAFASISLLGMFILGGALLQEFRRPAAYPLWPRADTLKYYLAFCAPLIINTLISAVVWQRSGVFFLEQMSTIEQVGFFSLAFTVFSLFLSIGLALVSSFLPAISKDFGEGNWVRVREKVRQGLLIAMIYAVPVTFGGFVTLEAVFRLLYPKMLESVAVGHILFAGLIPGVLVSVFWIGIEAINKPWLTIRVGIGMTVINLALSLLLVPRYGAVGAAIASTLTQLFYAVSYYYIAQRLIGVSMAWRQLAQVVLIGLLTTLALPYLVMQQVPGLGGLGLAILLSALTYALLIWRSGYLHLFRETPRRATAEVGSD